MISLLLILAGAALLLLVVGDVYSTVLHARARGGVISESINAGVWTVARLIAFRLPRQRRHRFLNKIGPLLMPALVCALIIFLVAGYALIYLPHMPESFNVDPEASSPRWMESIYFSGITLMTVGYGDIAPRTLPMRAVALLEAASGFVLISLGVTYLITVYGALERKRAVALSFYHRADQGADAAGLIAHHFVGGEFVGLDSTLRTAASDLQSLVEAHVEHPVIHYFHPAEVHKSMPRVLFLVLETCSVIKACLDAEKYRGICCHPEVRSLDASARYVLGTLTAALRLDEEQGRRIRGAPARDDAPGEQERRWRDRWRGTLARLQDDGIETRPDRAESWDDYRRQRREWEAPLYRFALFLGYDWDEITGDRGMEYAANEDMEQPEGEGVRAEGRAQSTSAEC